MTLSGAIPSKGSPSAALPLPVGQLSVIHHVASVTLRHRPMPHTPHLRWLSPGGIMPHSLARPPPPSLHLFFSRKPVLLPKKINELG